MDSSLVLPDGVLLAAPVDSPLGILLSVIARLPRQLYRIISSESGETYQKTTQIDAALGGLSPDIADARSQSYHLMAAVARQKGVNYDEPVLLGYLKPVFAEKAFSPWTLKTTATEDGQAHHVLNRQRASAELAEDAPAREAPLELVEAADAAVYTGMQPGWINFLLEPAYYRDSFVACLLQPELVQLRPGEAEYIGAKPEQSLDTALIETPLGGMGERYALLCDGSSFFWALTEIQKHYPQIRYLKNQSHPNRALGLALWQLGETLNQGLKSFKFHDGAPIFGYFQSIEKHLEKYIRTHQPYIQSDTVAVFVREFIRNFFAVEGRLLYAMTDVVLAESLDHEERMREALYLFYRFFVRTEFARSMTALDFEGFLQRLCADLLEQGIVNDFTLAILLQNERYHKSLEKLLSGKTRLKELLEKGEPAAMAGMLLRRLKDEARLAPDLRYARYEFSQETAKSEKYFVLHTQMVDLLPRFIARAAQTTTHPRQTLEAMQHDIVRFFARRSHELGIGDRTIDNVARSFMRIIFGKQIQLLDIVEDKLDVCGLSLRGELGASGVIGPDLARMDHRAEYQVLRERRNQRTRHLLAQAGAPDCGQRADATYRRLVYALLLPDLENLMHLPTMRELFGSSEELFSRLILNTV